MPPRCSRSSCVPSSAIRPRVEHVDAVRVDDRRQAVRDHERRARVRDPLQRPLDRRLGLVVDRRRRLVEDQDRRILEERAGDGRRWRCPPESFCPRSPTTVSYPFGRRSMNSCASAPRARASTVARRRVGRAVRDVLAHRAVEEEHSWLTRPIWRRRPPSSAHRAAVRRPGSRRLPARRASAAASSACSCRSRSGRRTPSSRPA